MKPKTHPCPHCQSEISLDTVIRNHDKILTTSQQKLYCPQCNGEVETKLPLTEILVVFVVLVILLVYNYSDFELSKLAGSIVLSSFMIFCSFLMFRGVRKASFTKVKV